MPFLSIGIIAGILPEPCFMRHRKILDQPPNHIRWKNLENENVGNEKNTFDNFKNIVDEILKSQKGPTQDITPKFNLSFYYKQNYLRIEDVQETKGPLPPCQSWPLRKVGYVADDTAARYGEPKHEVNFSKYGKCLSIYILTDMRL